MAKIKLEYQVRDIFSDRYEVCELEHEIDGSKEFRDNLDDAFSKACDLGADPNRQIRWRVID